MLIKVRNIDKHSWYSNLNGWLLEVEREIVTNLFGYECAPRYVATKDQQKKLVAFFGAKYVPQIVCIMVDEADVVAIDEVDFIGIDKHNFLAAMTNLSRAHGFHFGQNDSIYVCHNEFGKPHTWIAGWDNNDQQYHHKIEGFR